MKYMFLHGLGQNALSWEDTIKSMEGRSDIVCPDLFDFLHNEEICYKNLYRGFSEYCMSFSEPIDICGLSLGGILALEYGIENPDKVNSLALIGTQYAMPKSLLRLQNMIFRMMPGKMFDQTGFGKKDFINLSKSMMDLNFEPDLKNISCPVLIVCGENDKVNKRAAIEMKEKIADSKIVFIENSGHEVNKEAPEALGKTLKLFFKNT